MSDFLDAFKRELAKGVRESLRPSVAFTLKEMYGGALDVQSEDYWNREADEFLSRMKDHARAKRASK